MKQFQMDTILAAVAFAAHKHSDQRRKDAKASPYINHPIALARILREEGKVEDPAVIAAALLHDTLEDTQTEYQEIKGLFGAKIADMVVEVTDTKWLKKHLRKRLQISKASRSSEGAKLIKLADKIANLRDIIASPPANWSVERKREYFDWAKRVVDGVRGTNVRLEKAIRFSVSKAPVVPSNANGAVQQRCL
jgi:guanosine-3',5'-bis(diphosphate) 3'-pyrophosphohydrolase